MAKSWTPAEVQFLRKNYKTMTAGEIAQKLSRTAGAISIKASQLKLKKTRRWSKDEIEKVQKLYWDNPDMTYQDVANQIGFDVSAENVGWHIRNFWGR